MVQHFSHPAHIETHHYHSTKLHDTCSDWFLFKV
jgi:hypothetical protein